VSEREIDRSLIDAARPALGPSAAQKASLRERVVAAAEASGAKTGAGPKTPSGNGAIGAGSGIKIAALGLAAIAAIAVALWWTRPAPREPHTERPHVERTPERVQRAAREEPVPAPADPVAPAIAPPLQAESPEPAARPRVRQESRVEEAAPEPEPAPIADEMALLRSAHTALRSGDAQGALAALETHARQFPRGALLEERLATRVKALCRLGRIEEARTEAEIFLSAHPRSPYAAQVRTPCMQPH
jgi:type IV secretory pathway VirB10-like protein